jgi:hypothetical protein
MLVALAVAAYAAGWRPGPHVAARRLGIGLGAGLGLLWTVEITVNNVFPADRVPVGTRDIVDDVIWVGICLLTLVAAGVAARRAGRMAVGAGVGLWSGIVSGLFAYLAALLVAALFLSGPQHDPELIAGFAASGYPDLATDATFSLIGSPVGGAGGHLWLLGIAAGTLLGALGGFVGSLGRQPS